MSLIIKKKRIIIRTLFLIVLILGNTSKSLGFEFNSIIKKFCLIKVNSELKEAEKDLAKEIKEYTCDCFLEEINTSNNISQASLKCRDKTINKFKL